MIEPDTVEELYQIVKELCDFVEEHAKDEKDTVVEDYDRAMTVI